MATSEVDPITDQADEIGAPELIPLCAHHKAAIHNLTQKDHVGDEESARVAAEMRRQCCGRWLT